MGVSYEDGAVGAVRYPIPDFNLRTEGGERGVDAFDFVELTCIARGEVCVDEDEWHLATILWTDLDEYLIGAWIEMDEAMLGGIADLLAVDGEISVDGEVGVTGSGENDVHEYGKISEVTEVTGVTEVNGEEIPIYFCWVSLM